MIVNNNVNAVESGNVEHGGEFKIRNSAKAFSILSSGLYANKIRAIIRELSCNAIDSHKAAGNIDKEFDVHMPNRMEPHFAIRDYGIGLTHDEVTNLYTTYFESTKTGSNDYIGALGLGSKSPFSYTDNFTVTAIKNGEKNIYTAYISEQGLPTIARMSNEQTDEPAGVEVSFAVKEHDIYKFYEEATYVYATFEKHPNVIGSNYRKAYLGNVDEVMDGVTICSNNSLFSGAVAVMGNVMYPIAIPNQGEVLGDMANLLTVPVMIRFDIGELDIQASREGLSYIPQTINAIKARLVGINSELEKFVTEKLNGIPNEWEKHTYAQEQYRSAVFRSAMRAYFERNPSPFVETENGFRIRTSYPIPTKEAADKFNVQIRGWEKNYRGKCVKLYTNYNGDINIELKLNTTFIEDDINRGAQTRVMDYVRAKTEVRQEVYLLSAVDSDKPADFDGFLAYIHNPIKVLVASDLEKRVVTRKAGVKTSGINEVVQDGRHWRLDRLDDDEFDDEETYYYITTDRSNIKTTRFCDSNITDYMRRISHMGIDVSDINLYTVNSTAYKKIAKKVNWVNFEDYIEPMVKEFVNGEDVALVCALNTSRILDIVDEGVIKFINQGSPLCELHELYKKHEDKISAINQSSISYIADKFAVDISNLRNEIAKHAKIITDIDDMYPLAYHMRHFADNLVAEYINLVDKVAKV